KSRRLMPPMILALPAVQGSRLVRLPSEGRSPEAGENIAAFRREEIAISDGDHPRARRPGSAAEHLAGAKPGLGIVLIGVGRKSRIRLEHTRRPFPDIADRLAAAPGAVAGRMGGDVDAAERAAVEIGVAPPRRRVTPGIEPLALAEPVLRRRLGRRRDLPFELARKPPARPPAPGAGLVPIDMDRRLVRGERFRSLEAARREASSRGLPVDRVLGPGALAPAPSLVAPEFPVPIAAVLDEGGELGVGDGSARYAEGPDRDRMRPFFVVEHEARIGRRTELERPAGDVDVARPRPGRVVAGRSVGEFRLGIAERLPGVDEGFGVHVL